MLVAAGPVAAAPTIGAASSSHASSSTPAGVVPPVSGVAGAFVSLSPARILDTRYGTGAARAQVASHGTVHLLVAGAGGVPDAGVGAVVLNVTATNPTGSGFITAFPEGTSRPTASNLNVARGQTVPNLVVVKLGTGGKVALYNGTGGAVDLVADVAGYYLSGTAVDPGAFTALSPARILDTRYGTGAARAQVASHGTVHLLVAGAGGVPDAGVGAVVLNVTATNPTGSGFITAFPEGTSRPTASNLNVARGQTVPNLVVVKLGTGGKVALYNGTGGAVDLVADVAGYYLSGTAVDPGAFTALSPARILDTRYGTGAARAQVASHGTVHLLVAGAGGVPDAGVGAVVLNVTATNPTGSGFITAFPEGTSRPTASNLNVARGQTVPNLVVVKLGTGGKVALYNGTGGAVDLVADVAGYVLAPVVSVDLGVTMAPRPDPSVTDFVVGCPGGTVTADVTAELGGSVVFDGQQAVTGSASVTVPLAPGQAVHWTLSVPGLADVQQQARCLPADFPAWQVTRPGTPASQWYVLTPTTGSGAPAIGNPLYVVVADNRGTPVWWTSTTSYRPIDAKPAPGGGGLMWAEAGIFFSLSTTYHEVGWDGTALGTVGAGANVDMHDLVPAPEGGWYAIRYVPRDCVGTGTDCADMTAYGGSTEATIIDCEIVRLDAAGSVVWTWNTRNHLAFSEWSDITPAGHVSQAHLDINGHDYWDINHLNSVADDGDGLIISFRNLDAVYRIKKSDGSVDWKLGGTPIARSLDVAGADRYPFLNSQHDARRLSDGHLTVFDNGSEGLRTPRVLELAVDPVALTASIVRSVEDPDVTFSPCCGSARPVPSGGFAIAWGGTGRFTETDASGLPVLSIDTGSIFSYRGVPLAPGVVSRATLQAGMDTMHPRATGG